MSLPIVHEGRAAAKAAPNAPLILIAWPSRGSTPPEFTLSCVQLQPPLNAHMAWCVNKGKLPAQARNEIIESALKVKATYTFFLDDDVLFPHVILYRLLTAARFHPEAGIVTAVVPTKVSPSEPMLYTDQSSGAFWDWPLGALVPIESAGAGSMIVNMDWVKKMGDGPWFDDVLETGTRAGAHRYRHTGQDRYFFETMIEKTGCRHLADTGLLLAHFSTEENRPYILPPEAPCFQRPRLGDAWVPFNLEGGAVTWRFYQGPLDSDPRFLGYLDWLDTLDPASEPAPQRMTEVLAEQVPA